MSEDLFMDFDINAYHDGMQVYTRDGRKATILHKTLRSRFPVVAVVASLGREGEEVYMYTNDGHHIGDQVPHQLDLQVKCKEVTVITVLYMLTGQVQVFAASFTDHVKAAEMANDSSRIILDRVITKHKVPIICGF